MEHARPRRARDHGRASASRRPTGAGCRWAAWKACGSAPTRRSASSAWCCPTRRATSRTRKAGTTGSRWCATRACRPSRRPTWSAGSPRASASATRRRSPRMQAMFAATPLEGYIACGEAVRDMDHRDLLPRVKPPTLVIIGRHDPATVPEAGEYICKNIPGAEHFMHRRRAYFQYRAAAAVQRRGPRIFDTALNINSARSQNCRRGTPVSIQQALGRAVYIPTR